MTVSVAMCTYNGAKYIEEQLDSILHQTRMVDEIVICDDCSTDGTIAILQKYAADFPCVIKYARNENNKGFKQNFFDTMRQCTGDIIFLSDQDDRWHEDKVARILNWLDKHSRIQLVFTDANIIDGDGKQTGNTAFSLIGFDKEKQKAATYGYMLDIFGICNRATGATMAIRKEFLKSFDEKWYKNEKYHDYALALESIGKEVCGFIVQPLIDYRIHNNNAAGINPIECLYYSPYMPVYAEFEGEYRWTVLSRKRRAFSRERCAFKYSLFGIRVFRSIFKYIDVYNGFWYKSFLYDWKDATFHSVLRIKNVFKRIKHHSLLETL